MYIAFNLNTIISIFDHPRAASGPRYRYNPVPSRTVCVAALQPVMRPVNRALSLNCQRR
jgi:hypothetical protein